MENTIPTATTPNPKTARVRKTVRGLLLYLVISAWAIPAFMLGQFAMLAIVPVSLVVFGTIRSPHRKELRWYTAAVAASYATPLIIWILRPDRAQSLSKDIHPSLVALIIAASLVLLARVYTKERLTR